VTFNDIQNEILFRSRAHGINWGGAPQNAATDFLAPYALAAFINEGYNEFLSFTKDTPIATLLLTTPSVANANNLALNPLPPTALGATNPSIMKVMRAYYTQAGSAMRRTRLISSIRFDFVTGGFVRRLGNYSSYPRFASQFLGERTLEFYPGFGVANDTISLWCIPDPQSSPAAVTAAQGGVLAAAADVPLIPPQFHGALVEYVLMKVFDPVNRQAGYDRAEKRWQQYLEEAAFFGSTFTEGDPEQGVLDNYISDDELGLIYDIP